MEAKNILNISRLYLFIRRQVLSNSGSWLVAFGGIAGVLLVISLLVAYFQPQNLAGLTGLYLSALFLGGYVFTAGIFNELHNPQKSYQFLTLPVSTTERLLGGWILTGILFPVLGILTMALIVLLANLVMNFTLDVTPFQSVFSSQSFTALKVYFVTQSIFLLGAAYFRKNNFLKTILALFIISMVVQIILVATAWALFSSHGDGGNGLNIGWEQLSPELDVVFTIYIPKIAKAIFWYLTVPFFLITTWFSLKERQV